MPGPALTAATAALTILVVDGEEIAILYRHAIGDAEARTREFGATIEQKTNKKVFPLLRKTQPGRGMVAAASKCTSLFSWASMGSLQGLQGVP